MIGNGIPSDLMVLQFDEKYVEIGSLPMIPELFTLLLDLSSRNMDELLYILCVLGSCTIALTPCKTAWQFTDPGDSGKTVLLNILHRALSPKYVIFHSSFIDK